MSDEYANYLLCERFGWAYDELMSQPSFFVRQMIDIMGIREKFYIKKNGRR